MSYGTQISPLVAELPSHGPKAPNDVWPEASDVDTARKRARVRSSTVSTLASAGAGPRVEPDDQPGRAGRNIADDPPTYRHYYPSHPMASPLGHAAGDRTGAHPRDDARPAENRDCLTTEAVPATFFRQSGALNGAPPVNPSALRRDVPSLHDARRSRTPAPKTPNDIGRQFSLLPQSIADPFPRFMPHPHRHPHPHPIYTSSPMPAPARQAQPQRPAERSQPSGYEPTTSDIPHNTIHGPRPIRPIPRLAESRLGSKQRGFGDHRASLDDGPATPRSGAADVTGYEQSIASSVSTGKKRPLAPPAAPFRLSRPGRQPALALVAGAVPEAVSTETYTAPWAHTPFAAHLASAPKAHLAADRPQRQRQGLEAYEPAQLQILGPVDPAHGSSSIEQTPAPEPASTVHHHHDRSITARHVQQIGPYPQPDPYPPRHRGTMARPRERSANHPASSRTVLPPLQHRSTRSDTPRPYAPTHAGASGPMQTIQTVHGRMALPVSRRSVSTSADRRPVQEAPGWSQTDTSRMDDKGGQVWALPSIESLLRGGASTRTGSRAYAASDGMGGAGGTGADAHGDSRVGQHAVPDRALAGPGRREARGHVSTDQ